MNYLLLKMDEKSMRGRAMRLLIQVWVRIDSLYDFMEHPIGFRGNTMQIQTQHTLTMIKYYT